MKKITIVLFVLIAFFVAGCLSDHDQNNEPSGKIPARQLTLYFANKDLTKVIAEKREITPENYTMQAAVELLIAGPKSDGLQRLFPQGVKCVGVKNDKGVATVDFNDALRLVKTQLGSGGQLLLVGALANTLTEFEGVTAIRIAIDGKPLKVLGEMDLSEPIGRSDELIEK